MAPGAQHTGNQRGVLGFRWDKGGGGSRSKYEIIGRGRQKKEKGEYELGTIEGGEGRAGGGSTVSYVCEETFSNVDVHTRSSI
jgi:hypothetical protein